MLLTSDFVINQYVLWFSSAVLILTTYSTQTKNQYQLFPFIHSFSHNTSAKNQLQAVQIPDICPSENAGLIRGAFSFTAGSFTDVYGPKDDDAGSGMKNMWNAIVTVFFIDTAHNLLDYIDTISYALCDASDGEGYWINYGPLLYHFEDDLSNRGDLKSDSNLSIELPLDKLVHVIETAGFVFLRLETKLKTTYASDPQAMGSWIYDCVFWVARKRKPGEVYESFVDRV